MDVKIFASIIDEATEQQIQSISNSEAYKDAIIRVMPDCHAGKGCTIGSVIQYTDKVIPCTVGVDIGCGMLVVELGKIDINLGKLDRIINSCIPSGCSVYEQATNHYSVPLNAEIPKDKEEYIQQSIGTLGGGNHFIEIDEDDEENKYLVIHSGSRHLGVMICNYWQEKAFSNLTKNTVAVREVIERLKAEGRHKEIQKTLKLLATPKIKKEEAYLEGEDLKHYLEDMEHCQHYASFNRMTIANTISQKMGWNLIKMCHFETIHNYIDIPNKIIRKGAVEATEEKKLIIPMNMRDGSLLCIGKGNQEWLNSAPHGAGRIMSREAARKNVNLEDFQASMHGVYTSSVCNETIDESPMAYKDAKQIMQDILPTVEIIKVIKPIYNFKAKS